MKIAAIVQARMGSSRLPGKVLKDLGGATVLDRVLNRLGRSRLIQESLVATTIEPADDAIVEYCERTGRKVFRGSEAGCARSLLPGRKIYERGRGGADYVGLSGD